MQLLDTLYKGHVAKTVLGDVVRFARDNLSDVEWNRDYWLHRAGFTDYTPARSAAGGFGMLVLGVVIGGIAALALAPKPGVELREEVRHRALDLMSRAQGAADQVARGESPVRA